MHGMLYSMKSANFLLGNRAVHVTIGLNDMLDADADHHSLTLS